MKNKSTSILAIAFLGTMLVLCFVTMVGGFLYIAQGAAPAPTAPPPQTTTEQAQKQQAEVYVDASCSGWFNRCGDVNVDTQQGQAQVAVAPKPAEDNDGSSPGEMIVIGLLIMFGLSCLVALAVAGPGMGYG